MVHTCKLRLVDLDTGEILKDGSRSSVEFQKLSKKSGNLLFDTWYDGFMDLIYQGRNLRLELSADEYTPLTELGLFQ